MTVQASSEDTLDAIVEAVRRSRASRSSTSPTGRSSSTSAGSSRSCRRRRSRRATTSRWPTRPAWRASAGRSRPTRRPAWNLTIKKNTVAVVSDGTAVLGLGDIGPEAAMPVMEGKADPLQGVRRRRRLADLPRDEGRRRDRRVLQGHRARLRRHQPRGHLGAALLRDRAAPAHRARHPRVPRRPARHGDRPLAALVNALKVVDKRIEDVKIVITGVGAAGIATSDILLHAGRENVIGCDRRRRRHRGAGLTPREGGFAERTNPDDEQGSADEVLAGADVFIGLSGPGAVTRGVRTMAKDAIVFAMANPTPEVAPEEIEVRRPSSGRAAPTTRTRSTTCSRSRASSAARSTSAPARSPRG